MAGITSSIGIGSGIDIGSIVQKLVVLEGQPMADQLNARQSAAQTRLSALGTLKGALSAFQTAAQSLKSSSTFSALTATSSNTALFTATASSSAVAANYSIGVTQLAQAQRQTTGAHATSAAFGAAGDVLNISVGGAGVNVTLGSDTTLSGIAAAVNGTANIGVTASVINDGNGNSYLSFTSKTSGAANTVSVTATTADPNLTTLAGELSLANGALPAAQQAQNASITVNGVTATSSSNTVSAIIPGVTLTLNSMGAASSTPNLNVAVDQTAINKKVDDFVAAYNSFQQVAKTLGGYDSASKKGGPLLGDSTLRSVVEQVRSDTTGVVSTVAAGSNYNSLAMLGIQVDRYGVMSVDKTKLAAAVTANSNALSDVFSSASGVAVRLDSRINSYVQAGGFLDAQTTGLNKTLHDVDQGRLDLQNRMAQFQASLQKQFTAMDVAVGTMNNTASYLSRVLSGQ